MYIFNNIYQLIIIDKSPLNHIRQGLRFANI